MKRVLLALGLLGLFINSAWGIFGTGPYIEGNIGYSGTGTSTINQASGRIDGANLNHFGWNINTGVMFFGLGVEAGYTRYSDLQYTSGDHSAPADMYSIHLAARVNHSVGPIMLFGKLGYGQLHRGSFQLPKVNEDARQASSLFWGFGAGIKVAVVTLQAQYQQVQGNNGLPTVNMLSAGVGYSF